MVMGRRPGVERSSWPVAVTDLAGLLGQMSVGLARVPFRRPWTGRATSPTTWPWPPPVRSCAPSWVTRRRSRSTSSAPSSSSSTTCAASSSRRSSTPAASTTRTPPWAGSWGSGSGPRTGRSGGTVLYLHGGGYVGTSPRMYSVFMAWLARRTGCDIFVPDLRLAPEFPFPADLEDATAALHGLLASGVDAAHLVLAGDSSGGGLVTTLVAADVRPERLPVAAVVLFSPEVNLQLDCPSVRENAHLDILPWNIPTTAYLNGVDPSSPLVSAIGQVLDGWPADLRLDRRRRDVPRRHPPLLVPPRRGRRRRGGPRGAGYVPRLPDPHAVVRRRTPDRRRRRGVRSTPTSGRRRGVGRRWHLGPAMPGGSPAPDADGGPAPAGAA